MFSQISSPKLRTKTETKWEKSGEKTAKKVEKKRKRKGEQNEETEICKLEKCNCAQLYSNFVFAYVEIFHIRITCDVYPDRIYSKHPSYIADQPYLNFHSWTIYELFLAACGAVNKTIKNCLQPIVLVDHSR